MGSCHRRVLGTRASSCLVRAGVSGGEPGEDSEGPWPQPVTGVRAPEDGRGLMLSCTWKSTEAYKAVTQTDNGL